jgi:hypothetical protein
MMASRETELAVPASSPFITARRLTALVRSRSLGWVLVPLVLGPVVFNAIALWPELSVVVPNLNDGAHHFLFIQRASEALETGQSPFDYWGPEVELGFPYFFYYQHLPHLVVIAVHRLLLRQVDLFTVFNLVRYLLLISFPLTVYWSMRRLGFSTIAGAVAAAASTLFASNKGYGFEYGSYIWRGHGMYTQLWAMHLSLITLACLNRLVERGRGYAAAVVASSVLGLSHLFYSYLMVPAALVLFLVGLSRANVGARLVRLLVVGGLAGIITAYLSVPFALGKAYLAASVYLEQWRYDSFGAPTVLTWLANGDMLDHQRLPVLTLLLALGIVAALLARTRPALVALGLLGVWLAMYFGRPTWGSLLHLMPMSEGFPFHRMVGGVHLAAIPLVGLGGEWIWQQMGLLSERWRAPAATLVVLAVLYPALADRHTHYVENTDWMDQARRAVDGDEDARTMLTTLKTLPPGRAHAGLRSNWGQGMSFGYLHFYNLLTADRIVAVAPPYASISLNADLIWHFDERNPAHYDLFNVRYVVAPSRLPAPALWQPIKRTPRYVLYEVRTGGAAGLVALDRRQSVSSQSGLFFQNRSWFMGTELTEGRFVRYDYPAPRDATTTLARAGTTAGACPDGGKITTERLAPGRIDLRVECATPATLMLKETYHPNWRVTVDGRPQRPFMVSPSFIGVDLPAGAHEIRAEYRSPFYKTALLVLGVCVLVATVLWRRQFDRLETVLRVPGQRHG